MGDPGATEVKGSDLIFSTYLVRKSMVIASSLAFRTAIWSTNREQRHAAVMIAKTPTVIMASTNVKPPADRLGKQETLPITFVGTKECMVCVFNWNTFRKELSTRHAIDGLGRQCNLPV
jgi:hypothetical protein